MKSTIFLLLVIASLNSCKGAHEMRMDEEIEVHKERLRLLNQFNKEAEWQVISDKLPLTGQRDNKKIMASEAAVEADEEMISNTLHTIDSLRPEKVNDGMNLYHFKLSRTVFSLLKPVPSLPFLLANRKLVLDAKS